jgi:hypothetical protein
VSAGTQAPSDYRRWKDNVGIIFASRPVGGYSHAFASENTFDLFAYGQTLAHGGGGTQNRDQFPDRTMSHNTVLINGEGQSENQQRAAWSGRIAAFQEGPEYVYMAGDATYAYPEQTGMQNYIRHVVFMRGQYFVMYDDLAADRPSTFQWLYHLNQEAGLKIHREQGFDLQVQDVRLRVRHLATQAGLAIENRPGDQGRINPLTGEDYSFKVGLERGSRLTDDMRYAQHIWVSTTRPAQKHHFLAVLYPYRDGTEAAAIEFAGDRAATVTLPDGTRDVIAFGERVPGTTVFVDIDAIRQGAR